MQRLTVITFLTISVFPLFATLADDIHLQASEPKVIRAIPAIYPRIAAIAKESGTVTVDVKIKPDGVVAEAKSVNGHKLFRFAAEKSAQQWVFNSITEQNVFRTVQLTFSFKLVPRTANPEELLPVFMPPYSVETRGTTPNYIYDKNVDPPNIKSKKSSQRRS